MAAQVDATAMQAWVFPAFSKGLRSWPIRQGQFRSSNFRNRQRHRYWRNFAAYAEKAIAANGGVATSAIKAEAALRGTKSG